MGLGNLFKAVVKTVVLPVEIVKDIVTLGIRKSMDGEFYTEKKVDEIADELNDVF